MLGHTFPPQHLLGCRGFGWEEGFPGRHVGVRHSPVVLPLSLFEALSRKDETLIPHWEKHSLNAGARMENGDCRGPQGTLKLEGIQAGFVFLRVQHS